MREMGGNPILPRGQPELLGTRLRRRARPSLGWIRSLALQGTGRHLGSRRTRGSLEVSHLSGLSVDRVGDSNSLSLGCRVVNAGYMIESICFLR
jgi:hypothetical protein